MSDINAGVPRCHDETSRDAPSASERASIPTYEADEAIYNNCLRWVAVLQGACFVAFASHFSQWAVLAIVVAIGVKAIYECIKVIMDLPECQ